MLYNTLSYIPIRTKTGRIPDFSNHHDKKPEVS